MKWRNPDATLAMAALLIPAFLLAGPSKKETDAHAAVETGKDPSRTQRTMARMRTLATIVESWKVDHDAYPVAADVGALAHLVEPRYFRAGGTPQADAWGTAFGYACDGKSYRIVSAGADRAFEKDSTNLSSPAAGPTDDPARDLVFSDGRFIQYPKPDAK